MHTTHNAAYGFKGAFGKSATWTERGERGLDALSMLVASYV